MHVAPRGTGSLILFALMRGGAAAFAVLVTLRAGGGTVTAPVGFNGASSLVATLTAASPPDPSLIAPAG